MFEVVVVVVVLAAVEYASLLWPLSDSFSRECKESIQSRLFLVFFYPKLLTLSRFPV